MSRSVQLVLFILLAVSIGNPFLASGTAYQLKQTYTIKIQVQNCPYDSVELEFIGKYKQISAVDKHECTELSFNLDDFQIDDWCQVKFLKGPTFFLIVTGNCQLNVNFSQPFSWDNANPRIEKSPYTLLLWNAFSTSNDFGIQRMEAKRKGRESELIQIDQEDFNYTRSLALASPSPSLASMALLWLQLMTARENNLKDKKPILDFVAHSLEDKFPHSSNVRTQVQSVLGIKNSWINLKR